MGAHHPAEVPALGHRPRDDRAAQGHQDLRRDDELVTELHVERRIFVPLSQVPRSLQDAVIATEDRRFYYHWGVDPIGIGRAVVQNYRRGRIVEGGSTITQQLTKVLF